MKSAITFMICLLMAFLGVKVARKGIAQINRPFEEKTMAAQVKPQKLLNEMPQQGVRAEDTVAVNRDLPREADSVIQASEISQDLDADTTVNDKVDYLSEIDTQNERMMEAL